VQCLQVDVSVLCVYIVRELILSSCWMLACTSPKLSNDHLRQR